MLRRKYNVTTSTRLAIHYSQWLLRVHMYICTAVKESLAQKEIDLGKVVSITLMVLEVRVWWAKKMILSVQFKHGNPIVEFHSTLKV